jgi:hypothetical protein
VGLLGMPDAGQPVAGDEGRSADLPTGLDAEPPQKGSLARNFGLIHLLLRIQ